MAGVRLQQLFWKNPVRFKFLAIAFLMITHDAVAQEREWTLNSSEKEAFLVFGVPDTDDVGLSFWCEIGTNKTSLFINGAPLQLKQNQSANIKVSIDEKVFSVKAKVAIDRKDHRSSLEGQFKNTDPILKAAESGSLLKVTVLSQTNTYPLVDADFIGLDRRCAGTMVN